jgi:hypothetical protein
VKAAIVALFATLLVSSASAAPRSFVQVVGGLDSPTDVARRPVTLRRSTSSSSRGRSRRSSAARR